MLTWPGARPKSSTAAAMSPPYSLATTAWNFVSVVMPSWAAIHESNGSPGWSVQMCRGAFTSLLHSPLVHPASWAVALLGLAWSPGAVHAGHPQLLSALAGTQPSGARIDSHVAAAAQRSMASPSSLGSAARRSMRSRRARHRLSISVAIQSGTG